MAFKTVKQKDCTQIYFENRDKKRYCIFILILLVQIVFIEVIRFNYELFRDGLSMLTALSGSLIFIFSFLSLLQKSLKLNQKAFRIEYKIFGMTMYKHAYLWKNIQKIAVEFTRLKDYDLLLHVNKRFIYLGESLDEEHSDALLKEIQLFHHYYI